MIDDDERVIVVSECDVELGEAAKLDVHRTGTLHRAFSVFVLDANGRVLLQRRAVGKYHSPGLWSNSCCGHPRPGEETGVAARRRLGEEMGIDADLTFLTSFIYSAALDRGLTEHELDHVFVGSTVSLPHHDPVEVGAWRWMDVAAVSDWLDAEPWAFTAWFAPAFERLLTAGEHCGLETSGRN